MSAFFALMTRWAWFGLGGALLLLGAYIALDRYGDRRYQEGVTATDAKWQKAFDELKAAAAKSASKADDAAAVRVEAFTEQAAKDQEKVNEAVRTGSSPLDALFN
jgi:type II secretory pathway component PulM